MLGVSRLIAFGLAGCSPRPTPWPAPEVARHAAATAAMDVATVLGRQAVNGLVLPLLDDAGPQALLRPSLPARLAQRVP